MAGPGKSRHENEAVGLVTLQVCCVADEIGSQGLTWIEDQGLRIKDQALGVATGGGVDRCPVLFTEEGEAGEEEGGGGGGARRFFFSRMISISLYPQIHSPPEGASQPLRTNFTYPHYEEPM